MKLSNLSTKAAVLAAALGALAVPALRADDGDAVAPHGVEMVWLGPSGAPVEAAQLYLEQAQPVLTLRLLNHDRVDYTVTARVLEDAGSQATRRTGSPGSVALAAGGTRDLTVPFGATSLAQLTHSGLVSVVLQACPTKGGRCLPGVSDPLFFHGVAGGVRIYGEAVLCSRFRCGDLLGTAPAEPGTWRVMGGGPLHGLPTNDGTTAGGAQ